MATVVPRYVVACAEEQWSLHVWERARPRNQAIVPFACRSWRHPGACRLWKGSQDFARISEAVKGNGFWVYMVFTYPQNAWPDKWLLYKAGVVHWARLRKRFARKWGKIAYVQTWERHLKGGAHCNVIVSSRSLAAACAGDGWKRVRRDWLEQAAVACGFGFRTWIEPVNDMDAISGYLVKLARELTSADGKDQIPNDAPPHFRRIRASRGLLPPPIKNELWTGRLRFCPADDPSLRRRPCTERGKKILTSLT
jgi:hypothetical protein